MDNNNLGSALLESIPETTLSTRLREEVKKTGRICIPAMVFSSTSFAVFIVTQSFIGHISSLDLAAYALVQSISMRFINGILLGMSSATETLCGQAFGARQYHMMGIYLQRSSLVNLSTATILLPLLIFSTPIYKLLGQADDISVATEDISLWFIPVIYTFSFIFPMQMFLQAQMKNSIIGWLSVGTFALHLLLSWLFVYVFDSGVPGAMGAMIISRWAVVFGAFIFVFGGWCGETWRGFSKLALDDLGPVIKLSISSGFMICLELWYNSVLVLLAGYSDDATVEISAFSICLNLNALEFMLALGLTTAACVRVSNELGRGNIDAAKLAIKLILCMAAALGLFFCVICIIFGKSYPYLFTSDEEVAEAAANLSGLLALTMLISGFQAVFSGVAVGCGSQVKVAIINVVSFYAIGVPIGCLLMFVADLGVKGIWVGMLAGMVVQITALVVLTLRIDWKEEVRKTTRRLDRFLLDSPQESPSEA